MGRLNIRVLPAVLLAGVLTSGLLAGGAAATAHALGTPQTAGTWRLLPKAPLAHSPYPGLTVAVWTGRRMIIHGIQFGAKSASGVTLAYRPATNHWQRLPNGPRPLTANGGDAAVWTGSQFLVFGLTSAAYRPSTNTWHPIARPPVTPSQITGWTGHKAIAWEGVCCGNTVNSAEAYNPATGKWHTLRSPLQNRTDAMGAWTGKLLVVAGGSHDVSVTREKIFRDGAAYNPATNSWRRIAPMPQRRAGGTAVWDGREIIFLGGIAPGSTLPSLRPMAYNPATNHWRLLPTMHYRHGGAFAAVWTGHQLLVWGGQYRHGGHWITPPRGEAYSPAANEWTLLPASPLSGRQGPAAAWTGRQMLLWGGFRENAGGRHKFLDGAAFTPR